MTDQPTSKITFHESGYEPGKEIIRLDKEGFHYRGQFIADAGEAHRLMVEFLRQNIQPEPQGPTDEELLETAAQAVGYEHVPIDENCLALARAVLQRWGRPAIEPQGPTDEELEATAKDAEILSMKKQGGLTSPTPDGIHAQLQEQRLAGLRAVAACFGRPAIEPVSVAERLPGPEDCDGEGCCWVASEDCPAWHRVSRHFDAWHYWLPHHALPVPQQEGAND